MASHIKKSPRQPAPRFDLIPSEPLRRLAARYALGAERYGDWAWQKQPLAFSDTINHIIDHLLHARDRQLRFEAGERPDPRLEDDDLAGSCWGTITLMAYQSSEHQPDDLRRVTELRKIGLSWRAIDLMMGYPDSPHGQKSRRLFLGLS